MANVIGQRYEIYNYHNIATLVPKNGEVVLMNNTPDFNEGIVRLFGDNKRTVSELYSAWTNGEASPFRPAKDQDVIDAATLAAAKQYSDERLLGVNIFISPVKTAASLPTTGLSNKVNYLCKVVADGNNSGVYQAVAGWTSAPVWTLYNKDVDLVDEQELAAAIRNNNNLLVKKEEMGAANGVATLDEKGTVPAAQLPSSGGLLAVATDNTLTGNGTAESPLKVSSVKQDKLNRTVVGNDNATGTVTDQGGNLSIPIPVTVAAPTSST